jgi:hypothetical protein
MLEAAPPRAVPARINPVVRNASSAMSPTIDSIARRRIPSVTTTLTPAASAARSASSVRSFRIVSSETEKVCRKLRNVDRLLGLKELE